MKYQLIKETRPSGDVFYSITYDDKYVDGTVTMSQELALRTFDKIKTTGLITKVEIIDTFEIPEKTILDETK